MPTGDPATPFCTSLVRVASLGVDPAVRQTLRSDAYVYRAPDGAIVLLAAGYYRWLTGGTLQDPVFEIIPIIEANLLAAVRALDPSKDLADVAAAYVEHAHPDHVGLLELLRARRTTPLEVWAGAGDRWMMENTLDPQGLGRDRPGCWASGSVVYPPNVVPAFVSPEYDVHYVDTSAAAISPSQWVDGGHGVMLIAAPSHTPGSLMLHLPDINAVITNNHLRPSDAGTTGDCPSGENSQCFVSCALYADSLRAFPAGARVLRIHP